MAVNELIEESPTKPQRLYNVTCAYCGLALTKDNTTKEHVVGRRFVPKGTLENEWNLILNACASCNNRKAELENDISAISMQPDVRGKHFSDHPQLAADAAHKGQRAHSRYTGKLIADSKTEMQINYEFAPGVTISFNMVGQPAVDERRLFELALRHFQAFFYLVTYDEQEKRGKFWRGSYLAIQAVSKNDWGNDVARAFMEQTRAWKTHVQAITAHGH